MNPSETAGHGAETISDIDTEAMLLRIEDHLAQVLLKIDHMDEQVHVLVRVIDEHRPLLARAAALADPGAKVRAILHPRRKESDG